MYKNMKIDLIKRHLPPSMEISKVHMHQTSTNINYTKT